VQLTSIENLSLGHPGFASATGNIAALRTAGFRWVTFSH